MERPHAVGLGTGLPRALPAGSACSAWGPAGCWHPGEPRAAPRRGAPRCHPAPRCVLRSLQEATGQGGGRGRSPQEPSSGPHAIRTPAGLHVLAAQLQGEGFGKVRAAPSTGAGSSRSARRLCCGDYGKFLGTQRPAPRLPPQRVPASGLPAPTHPPRAATPPSQGPTPAATLQPRPPARQCCGFRGLAALSCSEHTAERLPRAGEDGSGRGELCPRVSGWGEIPGEFPHPHTELEPGEKRRRPFMVGDKEDAGAGKAATTSWLRHEPPCHGQPPALALELSCVPVPAQGTEPPILVPSVFWDTVPPGRGAAPPAQPCPGASPTAGRSWAVGSGTQHPSGLRSGPGTERALTAKCFECSAAIRQHWLRPRFPSSSTPRGRRRVNTVSGPTGIGTSRCPSPPGSENGPPGQPPPIARPPPTTDSRGTGAVQELPASPLPTTELEATRGPERHQQPPPTARGMQPPKARRGPPLGAESSQERTAPTPRCARAAPAPRPDGIAGPPSPMAVGGQDGNRASHQEELRRSWGSPPYPDAWSRTARRHLRPNDAPRAPTAPLTGRRERSAARPRGGARPSRGGGEQQQQEEEKRAEPGARPAHGPAATERRAANPPVSTRRSR